MLASLYIGYVMVLAGIKPEYAPPLPESERKVTLPPESAAMAAAIGPNAVPSLVKVLRGPENPSTPRAHARRQLLVALSPAIFFLLLKALTWPSPPKPNSVADTTGMHQGPRSEQ